MYAIRSYYVILDLGKLGELNSQKGNAGKFCLGDTVVLACGAWKDGGLRYLHEREAVYDRKTGTYVERKCYEARKLLN